MVGIVRRIGNVIFTTIVMFLLLIVALAPIILIYYLFVYFMNHVPGITYFTANTFDRMRFIILFCILGVIVLGFFESILKKIIVVKNTWNICFKYIALFLLNVIYTQLFIIASADVQANLLGVFLITLFIYSVDLLLSGFLYLLNKIDKKSKAKS